jgi:hypothetical protein
MMRVKQLQLSCAGLRGVCRVLLMVSISNTFATH